MKSQILTINELLDKNYQLPYTGLFRVENNAPQFLTHYLQNELEIDETMIAPLFGSRRFHAVSFGNITEVETFRKTWRTWLSMNAENWQRIFDAIAEEYKPMENYNKTSVVTTSYTGKETNTDTLADIHTTTFSGTETTSDTTDMTTGTTYAGSETNATTHNTTDTTTNAGSESNVKTLNTSHTTGKSGTETVTDTIATATNTSTDSFKAFDVPSNGNFADRGKTEQILGNHTDTHATTFSNRADTTADTGTETNVTSFTDRATTETTTGTDSVVTSFNSRTDTTRNNGSVVHSKEYDERADVLSNTGTVTHDKEFTDRKDEVSEHTYGNIGVTTNDTMLSSFIDLRRTLDFYSKLFKEFLYTYTW